MSLLGSSPPRPDGAAKVDGSLRYANDLPAAGIWHGATLRSPHPHARIRRLQWRPERAPAGAVCVTAGDLPGPNGVQLLDDDWPVLLAVQLPHGVDDRRYADQWGWIPGMGHSVVALGRTPDGGIIVGDPAGGLERWTEADLKVLWHGAGVRVK